MSQEIFTVQNVKCGGCASTIEAGIGEMPGVSTISINIDSGEVTIAGDALNRAALSAKLTELGYPEA